MAKLWGFNYDKLGYDTVDQMFINMSGSIAAQLDGFFMALEYNNNVSDGFFSALGFNNNNVSCLDSLKTNDFVGFAACYNASGQDQIYGDKT